MTNPLIGVCSECAAHVESCDGELPFDCTACGAFDGVTKWDPSSFPVALRPSGTSIVTEFPTHVGDGPTGHDFAPEIRALVDAGDASDDSWHNNAWPSVGAYNGNGEPVVVLWDGGRDHATGELPLSNRFLVMLCVGAGPAYEEPETVYAGNDAAAAVAEFRRAYDLVAVLRPVSA